MTTDAVGAEMLCWTGSGLAILVAAIGVRRAPVMTRRLD